MKNFNLQRWLTVSLISSMSTIVLGAFKVQPLILSTSQLRADKRWMFEAHPIPPKSPPAIAALGEMRAAQLAKDEAHCLRASVKAYKFEPTLSAWISNAALMCAIEGLKNSRLKPPAVAILLARLEKNPEWSTTGPAHVSIRHNWIDATLLLIEAELKSDRAQAWAEIEKISRLESEMSVDEKAELYRLAGEILFVEQNLEGAQSFFERSVRAKPSSVVRERLRAFKNALADDLPTPAVPTPPKKTKDAVVAGVEFSAEENEIVARVTIALKDGDLFAALEDALKLDHAFPGSTHTQWAKEHMLEGYFNILAKTDKQYDAVKDRYLRMMSRFDNETLYEWAKKLYGRGFYTEASVLAQRSLAGIDGTSLATPIFSLAARAALATENFVDAEKYFSILVAKHAGTNEAVEAVFNLGLLEYRKKNFSRAAAHFERLLILPRAENWELSGHYWLWRCLQKTNSVRAGEEAKILIDKFPFSYYGLRARADSGGVINSTFTPQKTSFKIWLTQAERQTLQRVDTLIQAEWWDEAQQELRTLPAPTNANEKALMALYFAKAMDYVRGSTLINEAWDQVGDFRNPPFLSAAFPIEFASAIEKEATTYRVDPILIRSVIKQESAFGLHAVSSSGALGLMQMIPPTAQEVAVQVGIKNLQLPDDMFRFDTNIHMGSFYLASLLDRYQQNVPMALAAYNAGPARLERWLSSRPSLADLKTRLSSQPDDEMWIDELPWSETRFYVKAILRNSLIYRLLEEGRVQVSEPLWRDLVKDRLNSN
jgi:soluble lytic murein transglycosylase